MAATLSSNFSTMPLILYGEFFNKTDPSTLNRNIGGKFDFSLGNLYVKHLIFYKNTYEFWALGSTVEYGPGKVASLDLKIQYEPQVFFLNVTHAPSNTQVIAHASPSLPLLTGSINITHGHHLVVETYGKIDISKYKVVGNVHIEPGNHKLTADGSWDSVNKALSVS